MSNLVWRKYVINKMPYWIEWFKNNHFQSYIEMLHRFIITNPYYLPKDNDSALVELGSDLDFVFGGADVPDASNSSKPALFKPVTPLIPFFFNSIFNSHTDGILYIILF